jgi:hypothetical protein
MGGERTLRLIFYDDAYLYAIQTSIHLLVLNLNIIASSICILSSYLPPTKIHEMDFLVPHLVAA